MNVSVQVPYGCKQRQRAPCLHSAYSALTVFSAFARLPVASTQFRSQFLEVKCTVAVLL
jgi:hypothetical protein